MEERLSFCRICLGHCGVVLTVDDDEKIVSIRGDNEDPQTLGYVCYKGLKANEALYSKQRILTPLKKQPDGSFQSIPLPQALDEIADKMRQLLDNYGPESIGGFKGSGGFFTSSSVRLLNSFLAALGSHKSFSTLTIDQSSKVVALARIGIWPPGRVPFSRADGFAIVGGNPLVSVSTNGFDLRNPLKRLKEAKARGMKLIVIDPRKSETAKFADIFLQPLPGEDCTILAGLLNVIFQNQWHDKAFCDEHVAKEDLTAFMQAVSPFTPEYVAKRADVPLDKFMEVARVFAYECKTAPITSSTGPDMSRQPNLAEHLVEAINIVCGRLLKVGDNIENPGAILPRYERRAQVIPPTRDWERGFKSRVGNYGLIDGELPSGILADEILQPGADKIRCMLVHGGNPASSVPDQEKMARALASLELLVTIEPFMTTTAQLSDYILPPTLPYERQDLPLFIYEMLWTLEPYSRHTDAITKPPQGAEVCDDHYYLRGIAKRLDLTLDYLGVPLDDSDTTEDILAKATANAPVDLAALKTSPRGMLFKDPPQFVEPPEPNNTNKFSLLPKDVAAELEDIQQHTSLADNTKFPFRLAVRRSRDMMNSIGLYQPAIKKREPYNRVYMNPQDMAHSSLTSGNEVKVTSPTGWVIAEVEADDTLRTGVISLIHGFGGLPQQSNYHTEGISVNRLTSTDVNLATINAMPLMSGIPVNVVLSN